MTHCYDAEDAKSPISWVNATVARWGGVDAMVNAAGIIRRSVSLMRARMSWMICGA
ncbi:hypothetical protein N2605_25230 [Bradyrhizobium yuanmingense]|uniref:hypothetical protein n=1 Tax=Bradyrhizobium yuanmingense TaxID=108015 RepID=UPI0021A2A9EA|nr:hypothetical protein [Bradyrhizobium sp. CB1024]UWU82874.1 hypothetical protein N2605_25230 [Bradyrhizobium sp. CB1024]